MNFAQKLGFFCLIVITAAYIYFSFFNKDGFNFNFNRPDDVPSGELIYNPQWQSEEQKAPLPELEKNEIKTVKIYVTDTKGNLRSINRECDSAVQKSCFKYAIQELIKAPSQWEKSKGLSSEIPSSTKILSIREDSRNILIDLSGDFESGGGAESTYIRIHQLIKTANSNTKLPVYLYINGKQKDVIGGEGVMIRQPLSERSLNE